jgi:hypothetical protein
VGFSGDGNQGNREREDTLAMLRSDSRSYRKDPLSWSEVSLLWKEQFVDTFTVSLNYSKYVIISAEWHF